MQASTQLKNQIAALTRLHEQVTEQLQHTRFEPQLENIRIRNMRSSKSGLLIGAAASCSVKVHFSADVVTHDENELNRI